MLKINDLKVGESKEFQIVIDEKSHEEFENITKDNSPVHNDEKTARKAGFENKILYGFHVVSHISRLYGALITEGSSVCVSQSIKFVKPLYLNEKINIKGIITHINQELKSVTVKNEIRNSKDEICITGEGILKLFI